MKNIAVIFGGKSVEHDISILTGLQVIANLDKKYKIIPIYITRQGQWCCGDKLTKLSTYAKFTSSGVKPCFFVPHSKNLFVKGLLKIKKIKIDCAVLALHGANGEDGSVQGLLELCEIPYTSSGIFGSSITMDKVQTKLLMKQLLVNTPDFLFFYDTDWSKKSQDILNQIDNKFKNNVVIKPARAGSSIGVAKCNSQKEIINAIETALCFDNKIIVEESVEDFQEINIACCGYQDKVEVSSLERIEGAGKLLDFDKKYITGTTVERFVDCKLDKKIKEEIQSIAKKMFVACECLGVVRLDFFVNKNSVVFLNEINNIPGSFANYLFKKQTFSNLLDKLIMLAEIRQKQKEKLTFLYESKALVCFENLPSGKVHK